MSRHLIITYSFLDLVWTLFLNILKRSVFSCLKKKRVNVPTNYMSKIIKFYLWFFSILCNYQILKTKIDISLYIAIQAIYIFFYFINPMICLLKAVCTIIILKYLTISISLCILWNYLLIRHKELGNITCKTYKVKNN